MNKGKKMKLNPNKSHILNKLLVSSASVIVLATAALTTTAVPGFSATKTNIEAQTNSKVNLIAQNSGNYRNSTFRLKFNYSGQEFVLNPLTTKPSSNLNLLVLDFWTKKHAQKIKSGAYQEGAEYPANAQVRIYYNPRKLSLQNWVKQSQDFAAPKKFSNVKIAGQNAIQFESSGLYEHKNVALVNPKNSHIIVVSLAQFGSGNDDAAYRRVYQQVINSLGFY
jgi:hypothetical protein